MNKQDLVKLKEVKINENETDVINPTYKKYDGDDREPFPPLKRKKGTKVYVLSCGHFTNSIVLFGNEKMCYCPVCHKENPEPEETKEIPTTNSYLCWDCQYQWIGDIQANKHHFGENFLVCPNCGSISEIRRKRIFPKNWTALRHECFKRDNYTCVECGRSKPDVILHCDHIIPPDAGGTDELDNLQTLCQDCNLAKSNQNWSSL